jgi:GGDEF domain-containing protein
MWVTQPVALRERRAPLRAEVAAALSVGGPLVDSLQASAEALVLGLGAALAQIWTWNEAEQALKLQATAGVCPQSDLPCARYQLLDGKRLVGVLALFTPVPLDDASLEALSAAADILTQGILRKHAEIKADAALVHQALHDGLTGLPNRGLLRVRVQEALCAEPGNGPPVALLLLDLDRFKEVNDTLGHQVGDILLQQIGKRLQSAVFPTDLVARLGGDEFAVLLARTSTAPTDWHCSASCGAPSSTTSCCCTTSPSWICATAR